MITRVAIPITGNDWNPIFNSIIVEPEDLAGGSFLKITGCDLEDNDATICLEWTEWDIFSIRPTPNFPVFGHNLD